MCLLISQLVVAVYDDIKNNIMRINNMCIVYVYKYVLNLVLILYTAVHYAKQQIGPDGPWPSLVRTFFIRKLKEITIIHTMLLSFVELLY